MTVLDLVSRIQQLQYQLGTAPTSGATGTSGAQFASALSAAQGTADVTTAAGAPSGHAVVAAARKYLGVPYVFGSTDPSKGLDCSSLVQRAYKDLGITLPRISRDQATVGTAVPNLAAAKPGDILAFNSPVDHVAIYIGDNKMIAAPQPGEKVKIQSVYETPTAIRRVIPDTGAVTAGEPVVRPAGLQSTGSLSGVPYSDLFTRIGAKHGVSPKLLAAVAKVESGYNPNAVSPAGARGGVNPLDPTQAVDGAARLLKRHLKDFGSLPLALAAYNAGGGAVRKYNGIPPYAETQAYVPKVQAAMAALG
jgi:peptidoglycan DL-endopeptidase CwlO